MLLLVQYGMDTNDFSHVGPMQPTSRAYCFMGAMRVRRRSPLGVRSARPPKLLLLDGGPAGETGTLPPATAWAGPGVPTLEPAGDIPGD